MFVKRKTLIAEINVVPYIDVMLVLLVIFMMTTPLLTQGVDVDLPKARSQVMSEQLEPIVVTVNDKGQLFLNVAQHPLAAISTKQLTTQVAAHIYLDKQQGKHRQVLVRGDELVKYGQVVQVMALLQQSGVKKVGLLTQDKDTA